MSFQSIVESLGRDISGFQAAAIMGHDGIPLAQHVTIESTDISELSISSSGLLKVAQDLFGETQVDEVSVKTPSGYCTLVPLDREYYAFVWASSKGLPGQIRYRLSRCVPELRAQLY